MNFRSRGSWVLGKRVIPNQLLQPAFDLVGAALLGLTTRRFGLIRMLDESQVSITTRAADFTVEGVDGLGIQIVGTALFSRTVLTSPTHFIELLSTDAVVLARAALSEPVPVDRTVTIRRVDEFRVAT